MFRKAVIAIVALSIFTSLIGLASAQAPLIVFLGRSVLGGFASGIGHKAGEEAYDRLRGNNSNGGSGQAPSSAPNYSPPPQSAPSTSPPVGVAPPSIPPHGFRMGFRNMYTNVVGIQFFAKRDGRMNVWPGPDRAYLFNPGDHHIISLGCQPGEKICFGAWSDRKYWGTGPRMQRACTNCCRYCGTDAGGLNLR